MNVRVRIVFGPVDFASVYGIRWGYETAQGVVKQEDKLVDLWEKYCNGGGW